MIMWFAALSVLGFLLISVALRGIGLTERIPPPLMLVIALVLPLIVPGLLVVELVTARVAVLAQSLFAFSWAVLSLFLMQRFAGPMEKTQLVRTAPWLYPLLSVILLASSVVAILRIASWPLIFVPLVIWVILGFACGEIAIRTYMRHCRRIHIEIDRAHAIGIINENQGRRPSVFLDTRERYPFP